MASQLGVRLAASQSSRRSGGQGRSRNHMARRAEASADREAQAGRVATARSFRRLTRQCSALVRVAKGFLAPRLAPRTLFTYQTASSRPSSATKTILTTPAQQSMDHYTAMNSSRRLPRYCGFDCASCSKNCVKESPTSTASLTSSGIDGIPTTFGGSLRKSNA